MKLELKHLAPYLPYKINALHYGIVKDVIGLELNSIKLWDAKFGNIYAGKKEIKPILRPLSDLTKEIEHNGEKCIPIEVLNRNNPWLMVEGESFVNFRSGQPKRNEDLPYWLVEHLFKWHFDVFGLIEKDLAFPKS